MPNSDLVQFMVRELVDAKYVGLGLHQFRVAPRLDEFIAVEVDGKGNLYKVIAVIHPFQPTARAADLIIEYLGPESELDDLLFG
jgi:hypothetical protein